MAPNPQRTAGGTFKLARMVGAGFQVLLLSLLWAWSILAIYFSNIPWSTVRTVLAVLFALGFLVAFLALRNRQRTTLIFLGAFSLILLWWVSISATNDRDWLPEYAVLPRATISGDTVTIHNIRNFEYRSEEDFTPRYYDKTFDLRNLESLDFTKSHWDGLEMIAHIILSFGFRGGEHLAVSIETRRARGQPGTSFVHGLFKQYGLIYILGDERDLIRLRTNFRREDVFLYPILISREQLRSVFLDILHRVNELANTPEFYNSLTQNCTTALLPHFERVRGGTTYDLRHILNGYLDQLVYERGKMDTKLSFPEAKKLHYINQYVGNQQDAKDFSRLIRPHLKVE